MTIMKALSIFMKIFFILWLSTGIAGASNSGVSIVKIAST
jgi:hypothetical protein